MVWVSPKHFSTLPVEEWSLDFRIDVFVSRVDGWHLQVAQRCINGWVVDGKECITAPLDYHNGETHHIPHSGWAVMQITMGYFETIGLFLNGRAIDIDKHYPLFVAGVKSVFPAFDGHQPSLANALWSDMRGGLYHSGIASGNIVISGSYPDVVSYDGDYMAWLINPHLFVTQLRTHFSDYAKLLSNPANIDERRKFNDAFVLKYVKNQL